MAETLLPERLEATDSLIEDLKKAEEMLDGVARTIGQLAEKLKGLAHAYENLWQKIVISVGKGQTAEMQAARPGLQSRFEGRIDLLKKTYALLMEFRKGGRTVLDPDFLLPEIAGMERLKSRVFDRWQSAEDLEKLAVELYPLSQSQLEQIAATQAPPAEWYEGEEEPLFQE